MTTNRIETAAKALYEANGGRWWEDVAPHIKMGWEVEVFRALESVRSKYPEGRKRIIEETHPLYPDPIYELETDR